MEKTETVKLEKQDTMLITSWGAAARTCGERKEDIKTTSFMLWAISWLLQALLPTAGRRGGGQDAGRKEKTQIYCLLRRILFLVYSSGLL